jgi:glycosyltransferase involved in cell wall biosynthesis
MKTIGQILGYLHLESGGPPVLAAAISRELKALNYEPVLIGPTPRGRKTSSLDHQPFEAIAATTDWPHRLLRSKALRQVLRQRIPSLDCVHINGFWNWTVTCAADLARRHDRPFMMTAHGVLEPWRVRQKQLKKQLFMQLSGRRRLQAAACVHVNTDEEIQGVRAMGYQGPVTVIPNGIDLPERADANAADAETIWPQLRNRRVVLFLSRISPEKGLVDLLTAWRSCIDKHDDALLVIAGSGSKANEAKVRQMIEAHGLSNHVLWPGFVSGDAKTALLRRADVYTLPSKSEGFSVSLLEALAFAKPVLITPGCHFPEVMQWEAGLCVPSEAQALAQGLDDLLGRSQTQLTTMGRNGLDLVKTHHTWPQVTRKLATVYECLDRGDPIPLYPEPLAAKGDGDAL